MSVKLLKGKSVTLGTVATSGPEVPVQVRPLLWQTTPTTVVSLGVSLAKGEDCAWCSGITPALYVTEEDHGNGSGGVLVPVGVCGRHARRYAVNG